MLNSFISVVSVIFSKNFQKTSFFSRFEISNPVVRGLEGVRVISAIVDLVSKFDCSTFKFCSFPDMMFLKIFQKFCRKLKFSKCLEKFEIPNPVVRVVGVLSGFANVDTKLYCSNLCSYRNMTFFMLFQKKSF